MQVEDTAEDKEEYFISNKYSDVYIYLKVQRHKLIKLEKGGFKKKMIQMFKNH